jgi:hypothetical protein
MQQPQGVQQYQPGQSQLAIQERGSTQETDVVGSSQKEAERQEFFRQL